MTDRRSLLLLAAGALAVGLIWWSPSVGGSSPRHESAPRPSSPVEADQGLPAARSVAAAVLRHVSGEVDSVSGTDGGEVSTMVAVELDDPPGTSYLVGVSKGPARARCQRRAVVCRRLADGSLISLKEASGKARGGAIPGFEGWAYRSDDSTVWLSVSATSGPPSAALAQAILADPEIGLHPHPETVAAGAEIDDFGRLELSLTAS